VYDYGATDFSAVYRTEFAFYVNHTRADSYAQNHDADLLALHAFGARTSIELSNYLRIGTNVADLVGEGLDTIDPSRILPPPGDYRINRTGLSLTRVLTRQVSLVVGGEFRYYWYSEIERDGEVVQDVRDEYHGSLTGSCLYTWHPRNTVSLVVQGSYMDFDYLGASTILMVALGDTWRITEAFSASLTLGGQYLDQRVEDEALGTLLSSSVHPTGSLELVYLLREFEFRLEGAYELRDSSGLSATVISRSVRFQVSWEPVVDLTLQGFGFYSKDEAVETEEGIDVESYQAGGSVAYRFRPWASASFRYLYVDQNALGDTGATYSDNRFILGVILALPESLG